MSLTTNIRRVAPLSLIACLFSLSAHAGPGCDAIFKATYPNTTTDEGGGCQTCHQSSFGGSTFNVYGADLLQNGASGGGFDCSAVDFAAALLAVESLDSDGEGNSNLEEIDANAQPGWCDETTSTTCTNSAGTPPDTQLDPAPVSAPAPANGIPTADPGGPYTGEAGTTLIQFDGSASTDPDDDALTYAWDFGDGSTADGVAPTHTYTAAGTYTVTLVVNDGADNSEPATTSAIISAPVMNLAPIADPGGPYSGEPGVAVQFDGSNSSDPNGDALTFAWDFGDGSFGDGPAPTHIYAADGNYTVTLVVSDGQLDSTPATVGVEIATAPANRTPSADAGGPYSGEPGLPVQLDGSGSSDPDGDALSYRWDFGDGTTGSGANPQHTYAAAGTYTVGLVVNDGQLDSSRAEAAVQVVEAAEASDGQTLYESYCAFCHGDPWAAPAVDESLSGLRRVAGARSCNIAGSIFGTSVFPNGVPEMQFLQGLTEAEIDAMAEYLNSQDTSGEQRYVTTCAGCHGNNGAGGRTGEDVHGESAHETWEAIYEEEEMQYMSCMPESDIDAIADYLATLDDDYDDDGIDDDDDRDDDNDGIDDHADSDDDGRSDGEEHEDGTDPLDSDSDDDGRSDGEEHEDGTDPRDEDSDDDGLDDGDEHDRGTNPNDPDTDDDGKTDGDEVMVFGTNPLKADNVAETDDSSGGGAVGLPLLLLFLVVGLISRRSRRLGT